MDTQSWRAEYDAVVSGACTIALTEWSQVELSGKDRAKFLHNMCTNDIQRLLPGELCEAFCTDVKGKILAHVLVIAEEEQLTLLTVPEQTERLIAHLDRYIIREDVTLHAGQPNSGWCIEVGNSANFTSDDSLVIECDLLWPGARLIRRSADRPTTATVETTSPAWTALRVESALPMYGVDFDHAHLPQEINRDSRAISFTKGCYLGQETVARIDALGRVNKTLELLRFCGDQVPPHGAKLLSNESEVGSVTTACWSPQFNAPLALGFIRRGSSEVGSKLSSDYGDVEVVVPVAKAT